MIIYTQRVEVIESYNERRDCADQMIPKFLMHCGYLAMPVPNVPSMIDDLIENVEVEGIFLSGGNSLVKYGGDAPERDETEQKLIEIAIKKDIPIFGICRGFQFIADYFGNSLLKIDNHVKCRHKIKGIINRESVNSYHRFGIYELNDDLEVLSCAEDNSIEAFKHKLKRIMAVSWHPEREMKFDDEDVLMIKKFYGGE